MNKPEVYIIGNHTQGLGILRSAASAGSKVTVLNDKHISLSRFSKYLYKYIKLPYGTLKKLHTSEGHEVLLSALLKEKILRRALLFGVNEDITKFIHQNAVKLRAKFFLPDVHLNLIYDKFLFNANLPIESQIETHILDWNSISDKRGGYIIKGRDGNLFRNITNEKAIPIEKLNERQKQKLRNSLKEDQIIIQKIVSTDKPILSVCCFSIEGKRNALFQYEKIRQHPNHFGTGTYLKSVYIPELIAPVEKILQLLRYTGISEIEFIFDCSTQSYKIIEMNPRPWKSINFATQCGQNMVEHYINYVAGDAGKYSSNYHVGLYWTDLMTDIPQLIREGKLFRYHKNTYECTWNKNDPLPSLVFPFLVPFILLKI